MSSYSEIAEEIATRRNELLLTRDSFVQTPFLESQVILEAMNMQFVGLIQSAKDEPYMYF